MKFSFGIITSQKARHILKVIKSIKKQTYLRISMKLLLLEVTKNLPLIIFATSLLMKQKRQAGLQEKKSHYFKR